MNDSSTIWYHNGSKHGMEELREVVKLSRVTHVFLWALHPHDVRSSHWQEHVKLCKDNKIKVVWCRSLFAMYGGTLGPLNEIKDMWSIKYLVNALRTVQAEAKQIGADYTAFELEPYANSPLKPIFFGETKLTRWQWLRMRFARWIACRLAGHVDFVLPAGTNVPRHPYSVYRLLCRKGGKITWHTYWEDPPSVYYDYDIPAYYFDIEKGDKGKYLPSQINEIPKPAMIFTYENALEVAKAIAEVK